MTAMLLRGADREHIGKVLAVKHFDIGPRELAESFEHVYPLLIYIEFHTGKKVSERIARRLKRTELFVLEAGLCAHALVMSAGLRREEQVLGDAGDEVLLTVDIAVTGGRAGIVAAEGDDSAVDDDHGVAERVAALDGLQSVGAAGSR